MLSEEQMKTLDNKLQRHGEIPDHFRGYLMQELPRAEGLLPQAAAGSQNRTIILRTLAKMYGILNIQLGTILQMMRYPVNQHQWESSEPLEILANFYPGLEATEWYQTQLGQMLIQGNHPFYQPIMTSGDEPLSYLLKDNGLPRTFKSDQFSNVTPPPKA